MKTFASPAAFAAHLSKLAVVGHEVTGHLAQRGGEQIRDEAKGKIGAYQESAGPFKAWAELAQSTKRDRKSAGFPENEPLLRTGGLRESIQMNRSGNDVTVGSASQIALYQETGTETIPPRSFLGAAAVTAQYQISFSAANALIAWVSGKSWRNPQIAIPPASGKS